LNVTTRIGTYLSLSTMKMLKVLSKTSLLSFILIVVLMSCKKDEPEPTPVDTNPIVGKWQFESVKPEVAGVSIPALELISAAIPCIGNLVLTFESNNKATASGCDQAVMFLSGYLTVGADTKWKVTGNKLQITNGSTVQELTIVQAATQLSVIVNTNSDLTKPAVNAVILFKKV
jgi:hypothetical protein